MKRIAYALPLLTVSLLSGCLLNQKDPAAVAPAKAFFIGAVALEDMVVANQGEFTKVQAEFAIKPSDKGTPAPVAATLTTAEGRQAATFDLFNAPPSRGPACRKVKVAKRPKADPGAEAPPKNTTRLSRVSVGRLGFGPALQESLVILKQNEKNQYLGILEPGLPAGAYVVVAEGSEGVDAFNEVLSVPEDIRHFRINGRNFGDNLIDFRPAQNLELFWKEPAITNDQNGILMELIMHDSDYTYDVNCSMKEDDIPSVSGFKNWTIDNGWFAEFPRTGRVEFYFIRAHLRTTQSKRSKVQLQGARTYYGPLDVRP